MTVSEGRRVFPKIDHPEVVTEAMVATRAEAHAALVTFYTTDPTSKGVEAGAVYRKMIEQNKNRGADLLGVIKALLFFEKSGIATVTLGEKGVSGAAPRYYKLTEDPNSSKD